MYKHANQIEEKKNMNYGFTGLCPLSQSVKKI